MRRAAGWLLGVALAGACLCAHALSRAPADAAASPRELASHHGCLACHGMVHKQVGPGFAKIAARYRDDAGALPRLAAKIRSGSVGTWGRVIMPRQPQVGEADAQALAAWVLAQPAPR